MRLKNMVVDEVSLVDKAANQRIFTFVKRNEDAMIKADDEKAAAEKAAAEAKTAADKKAAEDKAEADRKAAEAKAAADKKAADDKAAADAKAAADKAEADRLANEEFSPEDIKLLNEINATSNEIAAKL